MNWRQKIQWRFRALFRKRKLDTEMEEEMRTHMEMRMQSNMAVGMDPQEARYAALRQFGWKETIKETCRDQRGVSWFENFVRDVHFGLRMLGGNPGFTVVAVTTLALGIGANTTLFGVLNAVVLHRLPYPQPDQLVQLCEDPGGNGTGQNSVSGGVFADWREQNQCFQQISALWGIAGNLTGGDQPERLNGAEVSASFFDLLQVKPALGRAFLPEEDQPGRERVVVLDYDLWQRRFGGETNILDRTIHLDGRGYTVIGVLPEAFQFPFRKAQYWIPFGWGSAWWHQSRENNRLMVFARLKTDATLERARAEMKTLTERLKPVLPAYKKGWGATIVPLHESLVGDVRSPLLALMGAVSFVLLIACVNVANLMTVRAAARQREMAIRAAIGASRLRLLRQLLAESLTLGLAGAMLGALATVWGMRLLVALSPHALPRAQEVRIDGDVIVFSLGLSLLTAILSGLAPAWGILRLNLNDALKTGGRSSFTGGFQRLSRGLVMAEVALAMMLLVGAGLFLGSFQRLYSIDPGFKPDHVLTMQLKLPEFKYANGESKDRFFRTVIAAVEALPGVNSASVSTGVPLEDAHDNGVVLKGRPNSEYFGADYDFATSGYFQTLGIPLLKGRDFVPADHEKTPPVAIVNETFVKKCLAGDENPIGRRFIEDGQQEMEIIGVAGDVRGRSLTMPSNPQYYKPMAATDWSDFNLFIRTTDDPLPLAGLVRKAILEVDPDQPAANIRTVKGLVFESISEERFLMILSGCFALAAVLLAMMGVYGVMAYAVMRRTQEIGVRLALGAPQSGVLALVLRQGMATVLIGLALGLGGTWFLTRLLSSLLFQISPTDPATITAVTIILAGAAALACYFPARRAAKVDPMVALRHE